MTEAIHTSATGEGAGAEAIRAAAVEEEPRHRRLVTTPRHTQIVSALMVPDYAIAAPPGHGVLTTTGRRTGRPRRKVVRTIRRGEQVYVVMLRLPTAAIRAPTSIAAWVWNIRADPSVRLKLGRRTFAGTAREIEDPAERERARGVFCDPVHLIDFVECVVHLRGLPSREKIRALHRYWFDTGVPIVIELGASAAPSGRRRP
jgi:deazaflavin-dependent oxidoreductase (nitroreductase family)